MDVRKHSGICFAQRSLPSAPNRTTVDQGEFADRTKSYRPDWWDRPDSRRLCRLQAN